MRVRGGVTAVLIACAVQAAAQVPVPEDISATLELMRAAYAAHPEVSAAVVDSVDQSLSITLQDGTQMTSFPDNLHNILLAEPSAQERQAVLDQFVSGIIAQMTASEDGKTREAILPLVRHEDFGATADVTNAARPVSRAFVGDLRVFYGFDLPTSISYVTDLDLERLEETAESVHALALGNMAARAWAPRIEGDGIYFFALDGTYEASLLLDDGIWAQLGAQISSPLMIAPARDLVVFTDGSWDGAAATLRDILRDVQPDAAYPLSDLLFQRVDGAWIVVE